MKTKPKEKPQERPRQKVFLIDDQERHFALIAKILEDLGCEVVWSYEQAKRLRSNYDAYRRVAADVAPDFKQIVTELVSELVGSDYIWVIDVCWVEFPDRSSADRYGIDFIREFGVKKPILISLADSENYEHRIGGIRFVCKMDELGGFLSEKFKKDMQNALQALRTDGFVPVTESDENEIDSPYR